MQVHCPYLCLFQCVSIFISFYGHAVKTFIIGDLFSGRVRWVTGSQVFYNDAIFWL